MNFNNEIKELWEDNKETLSKIYGDKESILAPLLYPELESKCILTIGINPSFVPDRMAKIISKHPPKGLEHLKAATRDRSFVEELFLYSNIKKNAISWIDYETKAYEKYGYYSKHRGLPCSLGMPWTHIDMFYVRHKKQSDLLKQMNQKQNKEFRDEQIQLTKTIILRLKPKLILVGNAGSVRIYKKMFEDELGGLDKNEKLRNWDQERCCYYTVINNKPITTHFSGQISSMSNECFRRLLWVMKRSLE